MPNNPRGGGVSRRIEGEDRNELREVMDQLEIPEGMSLIARTAGIGRSAEELQWDLNYLLQLWNAIDKAAEEEKAPCLIYLESSLVVRAIRDLFQPDIGEILVDTPAIYDQALAFMSTVMPANVDKVKHYRDDIPLFSRFQIEHQIESAYRRDVTLPSGGAIVIDHTEALVSIDVNSARATRGHDIEQTAFNTNLEAADEVARQLRLRDLGGLIVIDFIDMESTKNQREVENRLRDALRHDRARVQIGKISRFGLLELSRQRLQPSLEETTHSPCPRCHGTGYIRDTSSTALHVLRILQEEAMKENTAAIHCQVPVDVATYLLNEKRSEIFGIEARLKVNVLLIPNPNLATPNYHVERLRHDAPELDSQVPSYERVTVPVEEAAQMPAMSPEAKPPRPEPLVKGIRPSQPAPMSAQPVAMQPVAATRQAPSAAHAEKAGILDKLFGWFRGPAEPPPQPTRAAPTPTPAIEERAPRDRQRTRDGQRRDRDDHRRDGRGQGQGRGAEDRPRGEGRGEGRGPKQEGRDDSRGEARRSGGEQQPRSEKQERRPDQQQPRRERGEGRGEGRPEGGRPQQGNRPPRPVPESLKADTEAPNVESQPVLESEPRTDDGDGGSRRRRRRGGRGGGDRPDRGDRGSRESSGGERGAPAQAAESHAFSEPQPRHESAPVHEPVSERAEPSAPVHEPVKPAAFSSGSLAPVAFQAVSQHDESEPEMHRPQRRKRLSESDQASQQSELQLVETQSEAPAIPEADDDLPRRTKPRRRRSASTEAEPLKLVETQPGAEAHPDSTPTS
jgi:ribonuclease E